MPNSHRPRHGRAFWADAVEDHSLPGLSVAKFCAERKLHPQIFYAWRRRLQQADSPRASADPGFVELTKGAQAPAASTLVIRCGDFELTVGSKVCRRLLGDVLATVKYAEADHAADHR
jgi:transposase-like protein